MFGSLVSLTIWETGRPVQKARRSGPGREALRRSRRKVAVSLAPTQAPPCAPEAREYPGAAPPVNATDAAAARRHCNNWWRSPLPRATFTMFSAAGDTLYKPCPRGKRWSFT